MFVEEAPSHLHSPFVIFKASLDVWFGLAFVLVSISSRFRRRFVKDEKSAPSDFLQETLAALVSCNRLSSVVFCDVDFPHRPIWSGN